MTGFEDDSRLDFDAKFPLVIVGGVANAAEGHYHCAHTMQANAVQAAQLKAKNPNLVVFVYIQSWVLMPYSDPEREVIQQATNSTANHGYFLKNDDDSLVNKSVVIMECDAPYLWWDMRNRSAQQFWLDRVLGVVLQQQGIDGVFFDDALGGGCMNEMTLPSRYTKSDQLEMLDAWVELSKTAAERLNAKNMTALFSWPDISFDDTPLPGRPLCAKDESYVLDKMGSEINFARFSQGITGFPGPAVTDLRPICRNYIANTIREATQYQMPVIEWGRTATPAVQASTLNVSDSVAAFLVSRAPYAYLAASSGWMDNNWAWHPEFEKDYGEPLGNGKEVQHGVFARNYSKCRVEMDCNTLKGKIEFL